jgi:hypothetical protein
MWASTGSGRIELNITKKQANQGSHQGPCDNDIDDLIHVPAIRRQLDKLDPQVVKTELEEYGCWNEEELSSHEINLQRILWLLCGDIVDGY